MSRGDPIDLAPPVEKAFLVAVDTGDDAGWTADDSLTELAALATTAGADVVGAEWQNRRHVDPNWYVGKGKAEELAPGPVRDRVRHPGRRRRAQPGPAEEPREPAQRQGHRPQPADPRHLRPARPDPRGPPPGRARAARVPAAAPHAPVDAPLAHPGRHRVPRSRRVAAGDGPPDHPRADQEDEGARRGRPPPARDHRARPRPAPVPDRRDRRLHERRQVDAAQRARRQRGRQGRGQAVRDARPDLAPGQAGRRADRDRDRHRGLHPQAAAPARRRVPRDARGGHPRRRARRGRRRRRTATTPSTGRRSRPSSTSSARATSRAWPRSTRPTSCTRAPTGRSRRRR